MMTEQSTNPFVGISQGVRRRADGAEIRRMKAPEIRELFRHAFTITVPWWIAFNADGSVMSSRVGLMVVGGPTVEKAEKSVASHERRLARACTTGTKKEPHRVTLPDGRIVAFYNYA